MLECAYNMTEPPNVSYPSLRPKPWFGPDDFDDTLGTIEEQTKLRELEIQQWDEAWKALPWYKRFIRTLFDEVSSCKIKP
jgi:hypothetical protein